MIPNIRLLHRSHYVNLNRPLKLNTIRGIRLLLKLLTIMI